MSATAMDNVRSATPGQVRCSPSVPAHWPIRRHVAAAETTPAGPLHSVEVTVPAKTNLTLHVGPAHEEWGGRHALDTIYCAIGVNDVVTATAKTPGSGFSLELSGEHLGDLASSGSDMRRNHAVLALFAIARAAGREPDVALHVDKHIPVGAGLGGGSADAAATLLAVNTLWGLHWPIERLRDIAATLGADMPFCLEGGYAHGTGFGERIIPLEDDSSCVQTLRDRGFAGQLLVGSYHVAIEARRMSTRPSTRWARETATTTICSAPRSPCTPAAAKPSKPPWPPGRSRSIRFRLPAHRSSRS